MYGHMYGHGVAPRVITTVYVYIYTWRAASHLVLSADVPGANFGIQIMRRICGAYAAAVALQTWHGVTGDFKLRWVILSL